MTEKKLEMEKAARTTQAKLLKLTITSFKGTASDRVRFENMFLTQVDCKPVTDEENLVISSRWYLGKCETKFPTSNLAPLARRRPGNG